MSQPDPIDCTHPDSQPVAVLAEPNGVPLTVFEDQPHRELDGHLARATISHCSTCGAKVIHLEMWRPPDRPGVDTYWTTDPVTGPPLIRINA